MTTATIQVQGRDLRVCTRSPTLGYIGLSPASGIPVSRLDVERQGAIHARRREMREIAWLRDLPVWMLESCHHGQVPNDCLLGTDRCHDAKFCLKQRLAEYAKRMNPND